MVALFLFRIKNSNTSKFQGEEKIFEGLVLNYKIDQQKQKIQMYLKVDREKLIANYTYQISEQEILKEKINYGAKVKIEGILVSPESNTIPNTFSYQKYLLGEKVYYLLQVSKIEITPSQNIWNRFKSAIRKRADSLPNSNYLKKLLLGVNENSNPEIEEIYRKNGISHVFAISGMHFGLLYYILLHWHQKWFKNSKIAYLLSFIGLSIYQTLLNSTISIRKAYTFFGLMTMNHLFSLKISKQKLFFLNLIIQLWISPYIFYQIGFQYSFILSFLFLFALKEEKTSWKKKINFCGLAFLGSLPITINQNGSLNLWSPICNLLFIPIITSLIFPNLFLSFLIPPFSCFSTMGIHLLETANVWCSKLPWNEIILPKISVFWCVIYYFLLVLFFRMKNKHLLISLNVFLASWCISPKLDSHGYIYFLDVGQGDCALIIAPYQKEVILIDTGSESEYLSKNILQFMKSLGIRKINLLVLSHGDEDHLGNAKQILDKIKVENIMLNQGAFNSLEYQLIEKYKNKIKTNYQSEFILINFLKHFLRETENKNSLITQICIWSTCSLFMGDADIEVEKELLQSYQINHVEILKVGHHGSKTSTSTDLITNINFRHAIISAGRNNMYHHPNIEVLNRLQDNGVQIWSTQNFGTITIKIHKKGYTISTSLP